MRVKLEDIINAIESTDDSSEYFLDRVTGEIVWLNDMMMDNDERETVSETLDEHGFFRLPTPYDINDYQIMENFIVSLPDGQARNRLSSAINGRGAFRRFKDTVRYEGLEQQWYDWKDSAYKQLAIEWCDDNGLEYDA